MSRKHPFYRPGEGAIILPRVDLFRRDEQYLAEYWEWSGSGLFPFDASNEAYKLGVNYMVYGLTH